MFENIKIGARPSITRVLPPSTAITSRIRGGGTPALPVSRALMGTREIAARPSITRVLPPSTSTRLTGSSVVSRVLPSSISMGFAGAPANIPLPSRVSAAMGDAAVRPLPTGRSVVSPVAGDRTGILPPSTLATQGVFGGDNGGMGAAEGAAPTALGPETLTGIGSSLSKIGTGIMNTITSVAPLAIKVILAVIVIKIVLWLLRGRR